MGVKWKKATKGEVVLTIYPGGATGSESDMIRKMRIGQLQSAAISNSGLAEIDRSAYALMIPGMFKNYEEWDYVRERSNPDMEEKLEAKGYVVLTWSDVGWVHFFSKKPLTDPIQLKKSKLASSVSDQTAVEIMKWAGLNPVPITLADMVMGLQTRLIDSFYLPIILAESLNLYRSAKNMTNLRWAPLQGAIILKKDTWDQIPAPRQKTIRRIAREAAQKLISQNRLREAASLEAMKKRGLIVHEVDAATERKWIETAQAAYPKIREELMPPEVFDKIQKIRDEYRKSKP
jgi:TRAP-type C4-dicarboxylate transport system substrate-binding protein